MKFLAWLLSLLFAFNLGSQSASTPTVTDEELRNKVQEHMDVIVDEGAALVDDVTDSIRNDDRVKDAEKFAQDVEEVTKETLDDLNQVYENTKNRVEEKFGTAGTGETEAGEKAPAETEDTVETEQAVEAEPEVTAEPEITVDGEAPQDAESFVDSALEVTPGEGTQDPSPAPAEVPQPAPEQEVKDGEPVNG